MTDFKARVLAQIDAGKEYENDGFGMLGLVTDYCEVHHWEDSIRDEIDMFVDSIRDESFTFESEEEFFESVNDWDVTETPQEWMQEEEVVQAGIKKCFDYLNRYDIAPATCVAELHTAVSFDLQRALVKAFCEVVKTVEDNDTEF